MRYTQIAMNSTEPDARFENLLVTAQQLCGEFLPRFSKENVIHKSILGVVMLIFNGSITILIISDHDSRNKHYRKYLCSVQVFA